MDNGACIKCGRDTRDGETFCDTCLAEMQKYPVKPGVVVLLPKREAQPVKTPRRRHSTIAPEEQLKKLKKRLLALYIALTVSLAAIAGLVWLTLHNYSETEDEKLLPGQNYSSDVDTPSETE